MPKIARKLLLAGLAVLMVSGEAWAIARVETLEHSCPEVKEIVRREGAAILRYPSSRNPDLVLYDRYVASRHFCVMGEITQRDWVPTGDGKSCLVLKCFRPDFDDPFLRF